MKAFFLGIVAALLCSVGFAGTQLLPEPSVQSISGATCAQYVSAQEVITRYGHQAVLGWSADGSQLFVQAGGKFPCGIGPHGSEKYYPYCGTFTWMITFDSLGNLEPIATATFTPTPGACGAFNAGPDYNALGYGVQVVNTPDPYSPTFSYSQAELVTP